MKDITSETELQKCILLSLPDSITKFMKAFMQRFNALKICSEKLR